MSRRCPECGARFPDSANVCDQHGVALAAAPERISPRRVAWIASLALAALLPSLLRQSILDAHEVTLGGAYLEQGGEAERGAKTREDWLAGKVLRVSFGVRGPGWLPVTTEPGGFGLRIAGQEATLAGGREWRLSLADPGLRGLLVRPPAEGVPCEIRAVVSLRLAGWEWKMPYQRRLVLHPKMAF